MGGSGYLCGELSLHLKVNRSSATRISSNMRSERPQTAAIFYLINDKDGSCRWGGACPRPQCSIERELPSSNTAQSNAISNHKFLCVGFPNWLTDQWSNCIYFCICSTTNLEIGWRCNIHPICIFPSIDNSVFWGFGKAIPKARIISFRIGACGGASYYW